MATWEQTGATTRKTRKKTDSSVEYGTVTKYPKKVMLWVAISEKGVSRPIFVQKKSVNGEIYQEKCIPMLKRFIEEKHRGCKVVHWPDLAPAHYDKSVLDELKRQKIPFVPKESSPQPCLKSGQLRSSLAF